LVNSFSEITLGYDSFDDFINSYETIIKRFPKKIQNKLLEKLSHEIDSPWKDMIGIFFNEFMEFFAPEIARDIDWGKAPIFLDKELSKIMKGAKTGKRFVDKLVQVIKCSGEERLVLFHVEVQGQKQSILPDRMYIYSNRLDDMYNMRTINEIFYILFLNIFRTIVCYYIKRLNT